MQHEPDVVLACAGDIPTQEALAAVALLKSLFHGLKIRFVNVVDLSRWFRRPCIRMACRTRRSTRCSRRTSR